MFFEGFFLLTYYPSLFEISGLYLDQEFSIRMNFTIVICKGVEYYFFILTIIGSMGCVCP